MDCSRAVLIGWIWGALAFASGALSGCADLGKTATVPSSLTPISLRETAWLAKDTQIEALSSERIVDRNALFLAALDAGLADGSGSPEALRRDLLAGEFLFQAPLLLGGQAAKAGISCHSCHVNGTDNPHFLFPAISGTAGTADTTHSFFSKSLGNQIFDPVAIPDLTNGGRVDHDMESGELEAFLTTIVTGEFSGTAVSPAVIAPMATYVRSLRLQGSDATPSSAARSITSDIADLQLTLDEAAHSASLGEGELAGLLLSSGQAQVQSIYERLHRPEHSALRKWLLARSREMGTLRQRLKTSQGELHSALLVLSKRFRSGPDFSGSQESSLYNPQLLEKALK